MKNHLEEKKQERNPIDGVRAGNTLLSLSLSLSKDYGKSLSSEREKNNNKIHCIKKY